MRSVKTQIRLTSALALIAGTMAVLPTNAFGQAYQGTPTVSSGSANIDRTVAGTDTITVSTNQTVINWLPDDQAISGAPIAFLNNGDTAIYQNDVALTGDFFVLNRVVPTDTTRAITLDGNIISQFQDSSGITTPGGNVWFYSPGGILVGSTSTIDVGGLFLTTADPVVDGNGEFVVGGTSVFQQAVSGTRVEILAGAAINALPEGSYVGMLAPRIVQSGGVTVNGVAAYIAAEAATLTFNPGGLFDIDVTIGTDGDAVGQAIVHQGFTTGPVSSGAGDNHRIYMVAVPKNDAITLAIVNGGPVGFNIAGAADVDGNAVVLSAGYDIAGGQIVSTPNSAINADISINNNEIHSNLIARAENNATIFASSGAFGLASNVSLTGGAQATVSAGGAGSSLNVVGDLVVSASNTATGDGVSATGGSAAVQAFNSGVISVGGDTTIGADGIGAVTFSGATSGSGTGGDAGIFVNSGGSATFGGDVQIAANGLAGVAASTGVNGGTGTGGEANMFVDGTNSSVSITGDLTLSAFGSGATGEIGGSGTGGGAGFNGDGSNINIAIGGNVAVFVDGFGGSGTSGAGGDGLGGGDSPGPNGFGAGAGTTITIGGDATVSAVGQGGNQSGTGIAGDGTGGSAGVTIFGTGGNISLGGDLIIDSAGIGGNTNGGTGGNGVGGNAQIFLPQGDVAIDGTTFIGAEGFGGDGATAGAGQGGAFANVAVNGPGTLTFGSDVTLSSNATGGSANTDNGTNGFGTARDARVVATLGGAIDFQGGVTVLADGFGGGTNNSSLSNGGDGNGGTASISQGTGGSISVTNDAVVQASGFGGLGNGTGFTGGVGRGGDARIAVNDLTISIGGNAQAAADGTGGSGGSDSNGSGGAGLGGIANLGAAVGTLSVGGDGIVSAQGFGGSAELSGAGGSASGGQALIGTLDSAADILISGGVLADASAEAGSAQGAGFDGGLATGGVAQIFATGGTVDIGLATLLSSSAQGGDSDGGNAGAAQGGNSFVTSNTAAGNIIMGGAVTALADATSGATFSGTGNGAGATGGNAAITTDLGGSQIMITGNVQASAGADGGSIFNGVTGAATGGFARIVSNSGAIAIDGAVTVDASAVGSDSTNGAEGGVGTGGIARIGVFSSGTGSVSITGNASVVADGDGGNVESTGGTGGLGDGGLADILAIQGDVNIGGNVNVSAGGTGGTTLTNAAGVTGGAGVAGEQVFDPVTGNIIAQGGAQIIGRNGSFTTNGFTVVQAIGLGGDGGAGGAGGDATGGDAIVQALNSIAVTAPQQNATMTFADIFVGASAVGGDGGAGIAGGNGGAGGNALGGQTIVTAAAGDGVLTIANLTNNAIAGGGDGGIGGDGATAGNGGAGGNATGGFTQTGTVSGTATTTNNGVATFGTISSAVDALGGAGADGGVGSAGGNGGAGGNGFGGQTTLLVRGSAVNITGNTTFTANGFGGVGGGGTGGAAAVGGVGGDGEAGNLDLLMSLRFQDTDRGVLNAGQITGQAVGFGGFDAAGLPSGASRYGTLGVVVQDSDATIAGLSFNTTGINGGAAGVTESFVAVRNGSLSVTNAFRVDTSGDLSLAVDNATFTANIAQFSAGNFVPDAFPPAVPNPGTIVANTLTLTSGLNVLTDASFDIAGNININVPGSVTVGNLTSDGVVAFIAGTGATVGTINAATTAFLRVLAGNLAAGDITGGSQVVVLTGAGNANVGTVNAGSSFTFNVQGGSVTTGDITAGTYTNGATSGSITTGLVTTGGPDIPAGPTNPNPTLSVAFNAANGVATGNVVSGGSISLRSTAGDLAMGDLTAAALVSLRAFGGSAAAGNIVAETSVNANVTGTLALGDVSANGLDPAGGPGIGLIATDALVAGVLNSVGAVNVQSRNASVLLGNVSGDNNIIIDAQTALTTGALTAGGLVQLDSVSGTIGTGSVVAGDLVNIESLAGALTLGAITGLDVELEAGTSIATGAIESGDSVIAVAGTTLNIAGPVTAGIVNASTDPNATYEIALLGFQSAVTGDLTAANRAGVGSVLGNVTTGDIDVGTDILVLAGTDIFTGSLTGAVGTAHNIYLASSQLLPLGGSFANFNPAPIFAAAPVLAGGTITINGAVNGGNLTAAAAGGVVAGDAIDSGGFVRALGFGDISVNDVTAAGRITLDSSQADISAGNLTGGGVLLSSALDLAVGEIASTNTVDLATDTGSASFENITADALVTFAVGGTVTGGDVTTEGSFNASVGESLTLNDVVTVGQFTSFVTGSTTLASVDADYVDIRSTGGNVTTGDIGSDTSLYIITSGAVNVGNLTAERVASDSRGFGLAIRSGQAVAGTLTALTTVIVGALSGGFQVGNIGAGDSVLLLSTGDQSVGAISAGTDAGDTVVAGNFSMAQLIGLNDDFSQVLTAPLVATGGSMSFGGSVQVSNFRAAAGTSFAASSSIAAPDLVEIVAGGTAAFNGEVTGNSIFVTSDDINITQTGRLGTGNTQILGLASSNAIQTQIGDFEQGMVVSSGYALSNAEFSRLRASNLNISGNANSTADVDLLIGDLTITGSLAGNQSNLSSSDGELDFDGNVEATNTIVVRIVGDIEASGFTSENEIEFEAGLFELDATTGSIEIFGASSTSGTSLSGLLNIEANRIHVASPEILARLADNPQYAGRFNDLNTPLATPRPDGVIRAGTIEVFEQAQAILVQNTGTVALPAGFVTFADGGLTADDPVSPGSIELVVNGQLLNADGTVVTGRDVLELLVPDDEVAAAFSEGSTINGCIIGGTECTTGRPEEPHGEEPPVPGTDVRDIVEEQSTTEEVLSEEEEEEAVEEATTKSPIARPVTIIDTRPLDSQPFIEEPVTSGGNPNLLATPQVDDVVTGGGE